MLKLNLLLGSLSAIVHIAGKTSFPVHFFLFNFKKFNTFNGNCAWSSSKADFTPKSLPFAMYADKIHEFLNLRDVTNDYENNR